MFRIQTLLQLHFISCRGVSGSRRQHARIQGFFGRGGGGGGGGSRPDGQKTAWTTYLFFGSSAYFTVYRGGPMVLLLRKLYLYFTKDPESGSIIFQGGRVSNFFQGGGPNANFFRTPSTYFLFSRGGGCPDPLSPLWIRTWAMSS